MKISFLPKTSLGIWSVGLINSFFIILVIFFLLLKSGEEGGDGFFENLTLAIPLLLAGASGIASFFVGLVSIVKSKERATTVFLSILIGLFILIFTIAEVFVPH